MSVEHWWNDIDRENQSTRRKSSATFYTTNSTWTGLELNLSLCGERLEPDCLSYVVAWSSEIHLSGTRKVQLVTPILQIVTS